MNFMGEANNLIKRATGKPDPFSVVSLARPRSNLYYVLTSKMRYKSQT